MKKVLTIALLLLVGLSANAQKWEKKIIEADAMKELVETVVYEWNNNDCSLVLFEGNNAWSINGVPFKPDPTHVNHRSNFETYAKVGLYDKNDNLLERWDKCCLELTNLYRTASSPSSKKKKGQYAVSDYLKTGNGYVRIIVPTITGGEFDVTIPCVNNE